MNRPYIICHMTTSIDGKVTGDFLFRPECAKATELYYEINRELKCDGYICGRVTMEGSFTRGYYPDLSEYAPVHHDHGFKMDFMLDDMSGFYAVAFDPKGRLGWKSNKIVDPDGDIGYDNAQIIEVLTEQVDERYLGYLEEMEIPYIFAGETEIDVELALFKLKNIIGCERLLLEGGSIINGVVEDSVIFRDVFVGNNCTIKNSIILNDVYIGDNTYIENCIVESHDTIRANSYHKGEGDIKIVIEKNDRFVI